MEDGALVIILMHGSTPMNTCTEPTEPNESVSTTATKKYMQLGAESVERDVGEIGQEMGGDLTTFHCISFSPLTKHPMRQDNFMMKENATCEAQSPFVFLIVYRNCCPWDCKG